MKDFYDLFVLARDFEFDGAALSLAIRSTFERRKTPIRGEAPLGLTAEFHDDPGKKIQWRSFLRKNRLEDSEIDLAQAVRAIGRFILPPAGALSGALPFDRLWPPGGPWQSVAPEARSAT